MLDAHPYRTPRDGFTDALQAFAGPVAARGPSDGSDAERAARLGALGLLDFVPALTPKWKRPAHLARMVELIERAEREPVFACFSVPPRHAKTETLLHAIVRTLIREPGISTCYASYGATFAEGKSRLARDYAANAGLGLRRDAGAMHEWIATNGSSVCAVGRGGPMTGRGFGRLFIDDPLKNREEAESKLIRDRCWEWFTSTALTRLEPNGSAFVTATRWHDDDMIGRLEKEAAKFQETQGEEGHPWEIVSLPALDDAGNALWPERYTATQLGRIRAKVGEYDWHSLYQQQPRPRGSRVFGVPHRYELVDLSGARLVIGVDVAITSRTRSNWTVACVLAVRGYGAEMTADVIEVVRMQAELPEVCRRLRSLQATYCAPLVVEASGVGRAVPQTMRDVDPGLDVVGVEVTADKFTRAQPYAAAWNTGRVRVRARPDAATAEFIRVHGGFTGVGDREDDDVDAGAHAWNHAQAWIEPVETGPAYGADQSEWS